MKKILCSTGSLLGRPNGRDFTLLPGLARQLCCDGFELMFYDTWYSREDALYQVAKTMDKPIFTFHADKSLCNKLMENSSTAPALEQFRINCQLCSALNVKTMILHLWDGRMSDEQIRSMFEIYPQLNIIAQQYGICLTIENIVTSQNSSLYYCQRLLAAHPSVVFTYDTKMAAFHEEEQALFLPENSAFSKRIHHLHLNDYAGGYKDWQQFKTLHIGDGHVDFSSLFSFLNTLPYQGFYTTEATSFDQTGLINVQKLNQTLQKLKEWIQE